MEDRVSETRSNLNSHQYNIADAHKATQLFGNKPAAYSIINYMGR
jgi:hypothetical protein